MSGLACVCPTTPIENWHHNHSVERWFILTRHCLSTLQNQCNYDNTPRPRMSMTDCSGVEKIVIITFRWSSHPRKNIRLLILTSYKKTMRSPFNTRVQWLLEYQGHPISVGSIIIDSSIPSYLLDSWQSSEWSFKHWALDCYYVLWVVRQVSFGWMSTASTRVYGVINRFHFVDTCFCEFHDFLQDPNPFGLLFSPCLQAWEDCPTNDEHWKRSLGRGVFEHSSVVQNARERPLSAEDLFGQVNGGGCEGVEGAHWGGVRSSVVRCGVKYAT